MSFLRLLQVCFASWTVLFAGEAIACPSDQYESCVLGACACLPKIGGDVGRGAEHLKNELKGQIGGNALAPYIQQSRNDAMRGAMPIPFHIRQTLTGYASEDSMNRVRYKIGDNGVANLAHLTMQMGWGDPQAITLIDVVVFRGPSEANDPALWAHELVHVDQYRDWGVHDFAIRYARNSNDVEAPAYAKGRDYWAWANTNGGPTANNPVGGGSMAMSGAFCHTVFGRFGPGPVQPFGAPCFVDGPGGRMFGQVGP
jgi:hypothetical protein